ncbi:MAG: GDSL-type esterase/lipase family protein [Flavobacteriaceae bacterium]|nr:GDSL-type esterase/lipase family protein [Flavobacteriaceae bacterium]
MIKYFFKLVFLVTFCVSAASCVSLKQYPLKSYSWAAKEIRQFEQLDKQISYPDNSILFLGSSSIRLWNTLEQDMNPFPVIKRGYGGAHFRDLIFYTDRILANHKPEIIVCFVANDIKGVPEDESPKKVLRLIKYFTRQVREKHPTIPLAFIEITPTSNRWKQWNEIKKVNQFIQDYTAKKDNLFFIETAPYFLNKSGKPRDELFVSDLLHLNKDGYALWNQIIKKEIIKIKGL